MNSRWGGFVDGLDRFDANGVVTQGPAEKPLEHCAVELDDLGNLTILQDATVDVAWRLPVSAA